MSHNLNIDLEKRTDKFKQTYYVGKVEAPAMLDLRDGVSFMIFIGDDGHEQLQISPLHSKNKRDEEIEELKRSIKHLKGQLRQAKADI